MWLVCFMLSQNKYSNKFDKDMFDLYTKYLIKQKKLYKIDKYQIKFKKINIMILYYLKK